MTNVDLRYAMERVINNAVAKASDIAYFDYHEQLDVMRDIINKWQKAGLDIVDAHFETEANNESNTNTNDTKSN